MQSAHSGPSWPLWVIRHFNPGGLGGGEAGRERGWGGEGMERGEEGDEGKGGEIYEEGREEVTKTKY